MPELLQLRILLPFSVFLDQTGVQGVVVETESGSHGLLPHRLDCVAAVEPGILTYTTEDKGEQYIAVDEGILVKEGFDVRISVRNAQGGADLEALFSAVENEFFNLDEREREVRTALARLESGFVRRMAGLQT